MTTNDPILGQDAPPPPPLVPDHAAAEIRDPYAALRNKNYLRYFVGNAFGLVGMQMASVTVGWELYSRTNSAAALGMVGLVQIAPILLLWLPAGHIVDRSNRKTLIMLASGTLVVLYTLMGFSSRYAGLLVPPGVHGAPSAAPDGVLGAINAGLAWISAMLGDSKAHFDDPHVPILFCLLLLTGAVRSINQPARQSIMPALVPPEQFSNAVTWSASLFETSNVIGPTVAGFAIAALQGSKGQDTCAYALMYWSNAVCQLVQLLNVARIEMKYTPRPRERMTLKSALAGVRFVAGNKVVLGVMTLDLFAVLLGGATALLPVFAKDILQVGSTGYGWLRAAPSFGAITMAIVVAHAPPMRRAGRNLLLAVTGFGVAIIVFGLSRNFWLSMAALVMTGMCDNISVIVRQTLVQLFTPDHMRGRVNAVNSVFISSSNELGAFESGSTAALGIRFLGPISGPMTAVAAGGVGTIVVVGLVSVLWPEVRKVKELAPPEDLEAEPQGFPVDVTKPDNSLNREDRRERGEKV